MDMNKRLELLSWVSNRRLQQTEMLFELCDNDFDKLLLLESKLKRRFFFAPDTPSTKENVEKILDPNYKP